MKRKNMSKREIKKNLMWYSFIIVSLITLLILVYIPMLTTIKYSTYKVGMLGYEEEFIGLKNYKMLLSQPQFWKTIGNTIILTVMGLVTIPLGFIMAVLINNLGNGKLQSFFRVGFYLPQIITGVSVVLIFRIVLQGDGGLLNSFLGYLSGRDVSIGWLADSRYSKIGATILWCWMNTGYSMLINLASIQAIPQELFDAAAVDGANSWKKLIYIVIPGMKSCFTLLFVTSMINGLARFTDLFIIGGNSASGGAGGSLQTVLMYIYQFSFESPNYGVSSAGSMILFVLVFLFTMLNVKLTGFLNDEV